MHAACNTGFIFHVADLQFSSSSDDWLFVTGSDTAKFKGTGMINGESEYKFQIWANDGGKTDFDTFRIKIWNEQDSEIVVYDNGFYQQINGGSIIVHKK